MAEFKQESLLIRDYCFLKRYKAITKVESGAKLLKIAKKYGAARNKIRTWLLPRNKEILSVF